MSQRGRKQQSQGREETECVLNLLPFLRKYLWHGLQAAGEIVSVRVWLSLRLYLDCQSSVRVSFLYTRTHTHTEAQPASRKISNAK